jgi:ferric-dicitrate binding protein FerR (iron transport regulator)
MATPPSSAVLSNTEALHKIFDAEFQSLLAQAKQELGEAVSLAPRVAEGAFVRAWDARGRLQTVDQVKQFLRDDVKAAAARALSRRAAIQQSGEAGQISLSTAEHVAASSAAVDLKVSWSHIVLAIQLDPQSAHSEKMTAQEFRHETAERLDHATRRSPLVAASIFGVIVVVVIGVVMYFNRMTTELAIERAMASPNGKVTASPYGQIGKITLGDGTEVLLAPDSKLFVPADFGDKIRPVKLDGAASFKVATGKSGDFRVYMRNAVVMAHGASFVVSGRWGDTAVVVKVTEGSVGIRIAGGSTNDVDAGHTALVDAAGTFHEAKPDEAEEAASWADGKLTMIDRPLSEVLPQLLRWYKLDVGVRDLKLLDRKATLRTNLDSGSVAVADVAKSAGLSVVSEPGGHTMLVDMAAKAPPPAKGTKKK